MRQLPMRVDFAKLTLMATMASVSPTSAQVQLLDQDKQELPPFAELGILLNDLTFKQDLGIDVTSPEDIDVPQLITREFENLSEQDYDSMTIK